MGLGGLVRGGREKHAFPTLHYTDLSSWSLFGMWWPWGLCVYVCVSRETQENLAEEEPQILFPTVTSDFPWGHEREL